MAVALLWAPLPLVVRGAAVAVMFGFGIWLCGESARRLGEHDHPGIVWDEIVGFLAIGTACMIAFPHVPSANSLLMLSAVMGFFVLGGFIGLYSVAARLYPTSIRAAGIGWGAGIGRVGAICGPYAGGILIGFGWSMPKYFVVLAIPLLLGAAAMWMLRAEQLDVRPVRTVPST